MRGSEVRFYADINDSRQLFGLFNGLGAFRYTETLSEENAPLLSFENPDELVRYLQDRHPQATNVFLITDAACEIRTYCSNQTDGSGVKLVAVQAFNPDAILIQLGGEFDNILVAHSINTTGETPEAKEKFKLFKKTLMKQSTYIEGFYVLPSALEKFRKGWRLTTGSGYSPSEDLKVKIAKV